MNIEDYVSEALKDIGAELKEYAEMAMKSIQDGANIFLKEMTDFVLYTPDITQDPVLIKLWGIIKIISFSLVGGMFVWEGLKKFLAVDNVLNTTEFKKMFVRMIYGLIMAIFSLDIVSLLLRFNEALINTMRDNFPVMIANEIGVSGLFSTIMVFVLMIVQIVIGVKLLLQYWIRIAELWFLAVTGPIVYTLWINPNWSNYLGSWFRKLISTVFTTFVWCILITLYSSMVSMVSSIDMLYGYSFLGPVASICLSVALLLVMTETPSFLREFMNDHGSMLQKIKSTSTNVVRGIKTPLNFASRVKGWMVKK